MTIGDQVAGLLFGVIEQCFSWFGSIMDSMPGISGLYITMFFIGSAVVKLLIPLIGGLLSSSDSDSAKADSGKRKRKGGG